MKTFRCLVCLLAFGLGFHALRAQVGGYNSFEFLRTSPTARITALGGSIVSLHDNDSNIAFMNPAALNDSTHSRISASFIKYLADIKYGTVSYSHTVKNIGHFWGGAQFINYGKFTEADEFGNAYGNFSATDLALVAGACREFGRFSFGMNLKLLHSNINRYSAWAGAVDFGGMYYARKADLGVGFALRNIGGQFNSFTPTGGTAALPFEIQVGVSKRIPFTPMRFTMTLTNLETPNLIYNDPNAPVQLDLAGNPIPKKSTVADNIFRHTVFGLEFLISRSIQLRLSYNHRRRMELNTPSESAFSLRGLAVGVGIRVWRFNLDYAYANYHTIGGVHHFSIATAITRFQKQPLPALNAPMKTKIPKEEWPQKKVKIKPEKQIKTPKTETQPAPAETPAPQKRKKKTETQP